MSPVRRRASAIASALLVAAVGTGLLALHGFGSLVHHGADAHSVAAPAVHDRGAAPAAHHGHAVPHAHAPDDAVGGRGPQTTASGATDGVGTAPGPEPGAGHAHGLLECILYLVAGSALAIALVRTTRHHRGAGTAPRVGRTLVALVSRPPPTTVRLSLVGTARC